MELCKIDEWVNQAGTSSVLELRQAIHTVITAISLSNYLSEKMVIKGGVLLAIRFQSTRYTKDIDFSTSEGYGEFKKEEFLEELSSNLTRAVDSLPYDLDCMVQSVEISPRKGGTYPTFKIKVGYAYKGTRKHEKLLAGQSPDTLQIDYSFNEKSTTLDFIEVDDDRTIKAYGLSDLVGEKYRALLQQTIRNRVRRQDAYDIYWLLSNGYLSEDKKQDILTSLKLKAKSRNIKVTPESIFDPDIKERSKQEYDSIAQEIEGDLPDFEMVYHKISEFYVSLPWE
jgi:hypothetical protein